MPAPSRSSVSVTRPSTRTLSSCKTGRRKLTSRLSTRPAMPAQSVTSLLSLERLKAPGTIGRSKPSFFAPSGSVKRPSPGPPVPSASDSIPM